MFCQNCGFQLPDNAKFCGKCGAVASSADAAPQQTGGQTAQPEAGTYQTYSAQSNQQSYSAQQQSNSAQQPNAQTYAPNYAAPRPASKSPIAKLLLLIGGALSVAGFFLPIISVSSYGYTVSVSLMDWSFGMGMLAGSFSIEQLPLALFLVGGVLSALFALIKPRLGLIGGIAGVAAVVYLFVASSMGGSSFADALQYAGIGFYLSAAGIVATCVGSVMAMAKK